MTTRAIAIAGAALVSLGTVSIAAEARIKCRDGFQRVQGNDLATPYCQDKFLARVAREYGMRVSDVAVRQNPNLKRHVCRFVGHDIRVQPNCNDENSRRRF